MPTKEEEFKQRLAGIMVDLTIVDDLNARLLIGGLAARIITHAGIKTWSAFNAQISRLDYGELLTTFQREGNQLARTGGAPEQVHAIEVLAVALVAKTQTDPEVVSESARLDGLIDSAILEFDRTQTISPIIS